MGKPVEKKFLVYGTSFGTKGYGDIDFSYVIPAEDGEEAYTIALSTAKEEFYTIRVTIKNIVRL